jgi:hypothetical protein
VFGRPRYSPEYTVDRSKYRSTGKRKTKIALSLPRQKTS